MVSIAVTGGIASGKSLFGKMLSSLGADVADADDMVRQLHAPGGKGASRVASAFGNNFLLPSGGTDCSQLASCVFSDRVARRRLEDLLHPLVREMLLSWKNTSLAKPIKIALIPLLFECEWQGDWDLTVDIEIPADVRLVRLRSRGLSEEAARQRILAQMTSAQRTEKADIVIYNHASIAELENAARRLMQYAEKKRT